MSLLLQGTDWHRSGEEEEEEEMGGGDLVETEEADLGLCFPCRMMAAKILRTCTWKNMDLRRKRTEMKNYCRLLAVMSSGRHFGNQAHIIC